MKFRVFWVTLPCSQVDVVNIYLTTRKYIPEDSILHTSRRENLTSHINKNVCLVHARRLSGVYTQAVSEIHVNTYGACSERKSVCKYGHLETSFPSYGLQDHLT
jgi:hypothetical protein